MAGLRVLRPTLPRGEVAPCQKVAVEALDLQGCPLLGLGELILSHEGTLGAEQTRCVGGTKPQLPGTSKAVLGLLTGTELHSQPPGMSQEWVFLIFPCISFDSFLFPPILP